MLLSETGVAGHGDGSAVVGDLYTEDARTMRHADLNGSVAVDALT